MFEAGAYDADTPFRDNTWGYSIEYAIKMILLLASYERIFESSRYLRELVCAEEESADQFLRFRNWNDYQCAFAFFESDTRTASGEEIRSFQGKATAIEKESNTEIHKLRLIGYLDMDNPPCRKCDCGGDPETVMVIGDDFAVRCDKCHISTRAFMTPEEAAMHWNRGDVSMPPLDLITDDLVGNLSGKVLYMDISHEDLEQYNRQSCECYTVMIVYEDRIIEAEHTENGENGAISVNTIGLYNQEMYDLRINAPADGNFELLKILYAEDGTVDGLKYRYGDRYLFVFASEHNLIVTKSLCDLTEEDDTPVPETEDSVLFV